MRLALGLLLLSMAGCRLDPGFDCTACTADDQCSSHRCRAGYCVTADEDPFRCPHSLADGGASSSNVDGGTTG